MSDKQFLRFCLDAMREKKTMTICDNATSSHEQLEICGRSNILSFYEGYDLPPPVGVDATG